MGEIPIVITECRTSPPRDDKYDNLWRIVNLYDSPQGIGAIPSQIRLTAPMPLGGIESMMNSRRDDILLGSTNWNIVFTSMKCVGGYMLCKVTAIPCRMTGATLHSYMHVISRASPL